MSRGFTDKDVPDQQGKTFFVTGANTGIGYHTARVLAGQGARVLMGCRNMDKARDAKDKILKAHPDADLKIVEIDLGDLKSIQQAAEVVKGEPRLDVLVNNAGLMIPPYQTTTDGFESQFGVNHLGTFALTGLLLEKLEEQEDARIVNTSSNGHKIGKMDFDNLNAQNGYSAMGQYTMSKLANLLHMYELDRRLKQHGCSTIAVAVHPGGSDTELSRHMGKFSRAFIPVVRPFLNSAAQGAWPTLMGATAPQVKGGDYFGPKGIAEMAGPAIKVGSTARSKDTKLAKKLWDVSIEMTNVTYASLT